MKKSEIDNNCLLVIEISVLIFAFGQKRFSVGTMGVWICLFAVKYLIKLFIFLGLVIHLVSKYVCLDGKQFSTGKLGTKADQITEPCYIDDFVSLRCCFA